MNRFLFSALFLVGLTGYSQAQQSDLTKLQGTWEITAIVDEGALVPEEVVKSRFAKEGRFEISGQAIGSISPTSLQKHTILFVLDEKASPKTLDLAGSEKTGGKGIYLLSDDVLMICISEPESKVRPTEFSAKKDSPQMLMTLKRIKNVAAKPADLSPPPDAKPAPVAAEKMKEEELRKALLGTWGHQDEDWVTLFTVNSDGTFSSSRNYKKKFGRLFNDDTRSSGTWKIQDGVVICNITASTDKEQRNQIFSYRIRSITPTELIAVDQFGKLRREWKAR